jgi:asparagine synthase (glutamine-hydrolysing)
MCGIAGIISKGSLPPEHAEQVARMSKAMLHRGPDGDGEFSSRHVALAHRRLSIIDLSHGQQPLYNEDSSLVLIANGEIYNFIELRSQLQARGHRFKTGSDCEVILHLYEEKGEDCVQQLRGMFAFALWDTQRHRLLLARDRMGEKPLYLCEREGQLYFASELKALLSMGIIPFQLDPHAIDCYFHYQYIPEPMTPIKGIRKLPPATVMTVTINPWRVDERCYWRMEDAPPLEGDPAKLIRAELETISELVIRSDVPVGIALSGGLDSSAIAALAVKKYPGSMHAFSVGYSGRPFYDERAGAKALADHLSMPFHEVEISTGDMVDGFSELIGWRDDPIADISGSGYYAVMRAAREHNVPVMLQGQGGDELFWGYPWLREAVRQSFRKSSLGATGMPKFGDYFKVNLYPEAWSKRGLWNWGTSLAGLRSSWGEFQRDRRGPRERAIFYDLTPDFPMAQRAIGHCYEPQFIESLGLSSAYDPFTLPLPWPRPDILITKLICQTYLLENGIAQGDQLSMANSIELRLPLVDYRLIETVIGLRKAQSDQRLPPKSWFKAAIKDILPDWVINRPKQGFRPPVKEWHRALFAQYGSQLENGFLTQAGVLTPQSARAFAEGPFTPGAIVPLSFKALVLELWCRRFNSSF